MPCYCHILYWDSNSFIIKNNEKRTFIFDCFGVIALLESGHGLQGEVFLLIFIITVMDKLNKILLLMLSTIFLHSCTYIYKESLIDILGISNINILSSDRYESQAIGEWYILEKYTLSDDNIQECVSKITSMQRSRKFEKIYLEDYCFLGWYPLSNKSPYYNLLLESSHFLPEKVVVSEYETCCQKCNGYFAIMAADSNSLDEFREKTCIVIDTCMHDVYICNYHF